MQQIANEKKSESNDSNPQDYETLELSISKVSVTNTRIEPSSDRAKLEEHLALFKKANFFHQNQWPFSTSSTARISPLFEKHPNDAYLYDNPLCIKTGTLPQSQSAVKALQTFYTMTTDSLKKVIHVSLQKRQCYLYVL